MNDAPFQRPVREIARAGVVWANTYGDSTAPCHSAASSSWGIDRELGSEVLDNDLQVKSWWLGDLT